MNDDLITRNLHTYWDTSYPLSVTTIYPAVAVDTESLTEWQEIWIDTWTRQPRRASASPIIDLSVSVHVFVRQTNDKTRLHQLSEAARDTLDGNTIAVNDFDQSGSPIVGYVKLREPQTRDLTRGRQNQGDPLTHHLITYAGTAESV